MSRKTRQRKSSGRILHHPAGYFLVFVCGGLVLLHIDPFGLTRLTKIYSQDLISIAMAGCYTRGPGKCGTQASLVTTPSDTHGDGDLGNTQVSVVLLSEADLSFAKETWPPSYGLHARVLRAIRANRPKAVLMDIVFEDERRDPTIAALRAELEAYATKSIPVYAATFGVERPLRPELRDRVTPVLVPKRIDPLDRVTRFYDLRTEDADRPTAALTVFHDQCGGDADGIRTIRLFWAALPNASWNHRWLTCRQRAAFPWWIFQDRTRDFRDDCPSTPTVPVRTLLAPSEADDSDIERLLTGRIVLYGTHFAGAADVLNTPLHNEIPGVYLHATALDNLITLGPQAVRHEESEVPWLGVAWADLLLLVVFGLFSAAARTHGRYDRWQTRIKSRIPFRIGRIALMLLGHQIGLLLLLVTLAAALACSIGAGPWIAGFGINFLFAVAWTELLHVSEKLGEAAEVVEPHDGTDHQQRQRDRRSDA